MVRTFFRADNLPVEGAAAKLTDFLPLKEFLAPKTTGTPDNSGPVGNDPADDGGGPLLDDEMVAVKESDDRIGCFFNADDVIRVEVHHLFVHAGQDYHGFTKIMEFSL
jgi:hypothetical protein